MMARRLTITPLAGIPRVVAGDDVAGLVIAAIEREALVPRAQDVIVVAQKIISKAEGRVVDLARVQPSPRAEELAAITAKDARQIELVLQESEAVLRAKKNVIVVAHRLGLVMANAGIDRSNVETDSVADPVLLLPVDPDRSAAEIKARLDSHFGVALGVIISDSVGRAWRLGTVGLAIGAAGVPSLIDRRGEPDLNGRPLEVTETGFADSVATAAVLMMGEGAENTPAAFVTGLSWTAPEKPARALVRPAGEDMFR
jgi:coenzyme F420-0:L-glutamate ligase/coenzyme F420-1:gamma-L-glutamate ligase